MSRHIEIWDTTNGGMVKSKGEYSEFSVTAIEMGDDEWDRDKGVSLRLYEHEDTGIFVRDIGKFEAWVEELRTR